jgi:CRP-like cAMP-binding protein
MSTAPKCVFRPELASELFRGLDKATLRPFLDAAARSYRSPGELFCRQGDPASSLFVLTSGVVKLSGTASDGKEVLLCWLYPGQCFGLGALLASSPTYLWTVCAAEESGALEWSNFRIKRLHFLPPRVYENALRVALYRSAQLQERFQEIGPRRVERRVAYLVEQLSEIARKRGAVELRVSDEDLAQLACTNLCTVSRVLARWQRAGYVTKGRGRLLVARPEELRRIAGRPSILGMP